MNKIASIMLATDFSEASKEATDYAKSLASQMNAKLHIVHVFDERVINIPSAYCFMPGAADWMDEYINKNKKRGEETLQKLCKEMTVPCEAHFLEGAPGKAVVDFATKHQVGLLVMGTHGYSALMRLVMGSVAEYVIHHCPCPVLTVRHKEVKTPS